MDNLVFKNKFQIIEIIIPGAGSEIILDKATETDHDEIDRIAIFKTSGNFGNGTLGIKIGGEEIFPDNFHASIITLNSENLNITINDVSWEVKKQAKGDTIQIQYKEPSDGAAGKIWLYLFTKKYEIPQNA